jgi:hypothetical protein
MYTRVRISDRGQPSHLHEVARVAHPRAPGARPARAPDATGRRLEKRRRPTSAAQDYDIA